MIDWSAFTPQASLAGGALIGTAAGLLVLLSGRIAGVSGILGGLLTCPRADLGWRIAFLAGLIGSTVVYALIHPLPAVSFEAGPGAMVVAGLLVGLGTGYGGGCTSGHGVCGLSRLSPHSVVATLSFMAAGFLTVYVLRHVRGG